MEVDIHPSEPGNQAGEGFGSVGGGYVEGFAEDVVGELGAEGFERGGFAGGGSDEPSAGGEGAGGVEADAGAGPDDNDSFHQRLSFRARMKSAVWGWVSTMWARRSRSFQAVGARALSETFRRNST